MLRFGQYGMIVKNYYPYVCVGTVKQTTPDQRLDCFTITYNPKILFESGCP